MSRLLICLLAALALAGCNISRSEARDSAAKHACDRLNACNQLGAGLAYPDYSTCELQQRNYWDLAWPTGTCENQISTSGFDGCIDAIDGAQCGNGLDILNIILNRCTATSVCP